MTENTKTEPQQATDPGAGIAGLADAEAREILNLLGESDAGGSCCGGGCCSTN